MLKSFLQEPQFLVSPTGKPNPRYEHEQPIDLNQEVDYLNSRYNHMLSIVQRQSVFDSKTLPVQIDSMSYNELAGQNQIAANISEFYTGFRGECEAVIKKIQEDKSKSYIGKPNINILSTILEK